MPPTGQQLGLAPTPNPSFTPIPQQAQPQATPSPYVPPPQPIGGNAAPLPPPTNLDPGVVKVMQAIRQVESQGNYSAVGDNGSSVGAYQWNNGGTPVKPGETPVNWQNAAQKYLGNAQAPMTPENQNFVAYHQIADYKAQGLTPNSIDALWNGASPDPQNPGQYVHNNPQRLLKFQQALSNPTPVANQTQQPQPQSQQNQPPSVGGFLQNVAGSAGNFLGNLGQAVTHPIQTVEGLGSAAVGGLQEAGGEQNSNTAAFDNIKNYFVGRYGSPQELMKTIYTDPVGFAMDASAALGLAGGAVGLAGKAADVAGLSDVADVAGSASNALGTASTVANPLTLPIMGVSSAVKAVLPTIAKTLGASVGLPGTATETLLNNGIAGYEDVSRESIAAEIQDAMASKTGTLSDTGAGYDALRNSAAYVNVDPTSLAKLIEDNTGATLDETGTVTAGGRIATPLQVRALQSFYDTYQPIFESGDLSANDFLNMRTYVATGLAKFGKELTSDPTLQLAGQGMYADLNNTYRPAFSGDNFAQGQYGSLEQMDSDYGAQKGSIAELSQGLFNKDGSLKANITSTIANATKPANAAKLAQLEELVPGVTKEITALQALEAIDKIYGQGGGGLTGSILKTGEVGTILGGAATGNVAVAATGLAAMLLATPEVIVPTIKFLGTLNDNGALLHAVAQQMAKVATSGAVIQASANSSSPTNSNTSQTPSTGQATQPQANTPPSTNTQGGISSPSSPETPAGSLPTSITSLPGYQAAIKAGYTPQEIQQFLASNPQ